MKYHNFLLLKPVWKEFKQIKAGIPRIWKKKFVGDKYEKINQR